MFWPDEAFEMMEIDRIGLTDSSVDNPVWSVSVKTNLRYQVQHFKMLLADRVGTVAINASAVCRRDCTSALVGRTTR